MLFDAEIKPKVILRNYQIKVKEEILLALKDSRSVLLQLPTGGGKTIVMGSIVDSCNKRPQGVYKTLTVAHRDELIDQTADRYFNQFGIYTGKIKSGVKPDYSINHQVASVATMVNRIENFNPNVILIDEAHHASASTYQKLVKAYPNAKIIGVTATPYRLSGEGLINTFEKIVLGPTVEELEKAGSLVAAKILVDRIDLSKVKMSKGDYDERQLNEAMIESEKVLSIVDTYIEKGEGKQMVVYATSIEHSKMIVEAFNWRGIKAAHVDGLSNDRHVIFRKFKSKEIQIISNVGIATEGNDIPSIEIISLARPTKSLSLFLQMVGRGSRPMQGKAEYLIFDHANNVFEHGLPNKNHDWEKHFIGTRKGGKSAKKPPKEKQFVLQLENGQQITRSLEKLPNGFKGKILRELDPSEYFSIEVVDRFNGFLDAALVRGQKPLSAFHRILDYCEQNKLPAPNDGIVRKIAEKLGWGNQFAIDRMNELVKSYKFIN